MGGGVEFVQNGHFNADPLNQHPWGMSGSPNVGGVDHLLVERIAIRSTNKLDRYSNLNALSLSAV